MNPHKILARILSSRHGIRFAEIRLLLEALGFTLERINGSHHIFKHPAVMEIVNIQDVKGEVKSYQIRQVLKLIENYNLKITEKP